MTIAFPRDLPDSLPAAALSFIPDAMIEVTPLRSGKKISADLGPTLWRAKWSAENLSPDQLDDVRTFYDTLLSLEAFYCYDKARPYPKAYASGFAGLTVGSNPFDGTAVLTAVASNAVEITIEQLPAGFIFSKGDYLAFDYGTDSRALHRISAAATADSSGTVTVEVRPFVQDGWQAVSPAVTTVLLAKPAAKMMIVPGSYSEQIAPPVIGQVSFEAIQTL